MPSKNQITLHEAIVLALISKPLRRATFEEVALFITKRRLFTCRKSNIPLAEQIRLRATLSKGKYSHLFEDLGSGYIELRDTNSNFLLKLWDAMEALLDFDQELFYASAKEIRVISKGTASKETIKVSLSPSDIICIVSPEKSRKKHIYFTEKDISGNTRIRYWLINNNKYNFEFLSRHFDSINRHLVQVSRNAIVNVAFFELVKKRELLYIHSGDKSGVPNRIQVTGGNEDHSFLQNFKKVQRYHKRSILFQKTLIGYKNDMGLHKPGTFGV